MQQIQEQNVFESAKKILAQLRYTNLKLAGYTEEEIAEDMQEWTNTRTYEGFQNWKNSQGY
jgi:hypothetical protein